MTWPLAKAVQASITGVVLTHSSEALQKNDEKPTGRNWGPQLDGVVRGRRDTETPPPVSYNPGSS